MIFTNGTILDMIVKAGIRPSVPRLAVLSYIATKRTHPSADEIFNELLVKIPKLSLTTVYNSLKALVEAGLVNELSIDPTCKRYDLAPQPRHSHFICKRCGKIYDMAYPTEIKMACTQGFDVDNIDIYLQGVCPECKTNNPK